MDYVGIGKRIRAQRLKLELSQEDLAEMAGISLVHMSHIETANTKLSLPVALRPGYETLYDRTFTCRPDSPKGLVRYQESRLYSCFGSTVQPDNCAERRRRCVTMDNIGYGRYSGEIQLVRADLPADEKVNVIGEVPAAYDLLLDCIQRGKTFRMVKVQ